MDESVKQAMRKWPNVPDVYGWLRLDARGRWHLRNGPVSNPKLIDFIGRNYLRLDDGSYVFQNGPQRVHVALEATPWHVHLREGAALAVVDHTGQEWAQVNAVLLSPEGQVMFRQDGEVGLLRDQDLVLLGPHWRSPNGEPLNDEAVLAALTQPHELRLAWSGQLLPVVGLDARPWPEQLNFVAEAVPPS
ncbi:MAG: DUF2946 family protein [Oceanococcaceae bacterium]